MSLFTRVCASHSVVCSGGSLAEAALHVSPTPVHLQDETMRLWRTDTGELIRTFVGHTRPVRQCCFSPDGARVLSGSIVRKPWTYRHSWWCFIMSAVARAPLGRLRSLEHMPLICRTKRAESGMQRQAHNSIPSPGTRSGRLHACGYRTAGPSSQPVTTGSVASGGRMTAPLSASTRPQAGCQQRQLSLLAREPPPDSPRRQLSQQRQSTVWSPASRQDKCSSYDAVCNVPPVQRHGAPFV